MTRPGIEYRSPRLLENTLLQWAFTQPPRHEQGVTQGQFLVELNSEFSFSLTGCHAKIAGWGVKNNWIYTFPKEISAI